MNKSELIAVIAEDTGLSKADAAKALNATLSTITECLQRDESVTIVGFGTFTVRENKAHEGRNPRTGEVIQIGASKRPFFKSGRTLRDKLN